MCSFWFVCFFIFVTCPPFGAPRLCLTSGEGSGRRLGTWQTNREEHGDRRRDQAISRGRDNGCVLAAVGATTAAWACRRAATTQRQAATERCDLSPKAVRHQARAPGKAARPLLSPQNSVAGFRRPLCFGGVWAVRRRDGALRGVPADGGVAEIAGRTRPEAPLRGQACPHQNRWECPGPPALCDCP
jgi:hypothetical protein